MPAAVTIPPARRPELVLRPLGSKGQYVIKDPATGAYYQVGEAEYFLLSCLDGTQDVETICAAFRAHFSEPFTPEDLEGFLELARSQGFLQAVDRPADGAASEGQSQPAQNRMRQSLLYWRLSLFDPDRLLNRLAPELRFLWTPSFLAVSGSAILLAGAVVWGNRQQLVSSFAQTWR